MEVLFSHYNKHYHYKILDFTYTSEPMINHALPIKKSMPKLVFFIIGCIITFGFLWLLTKWSASKKALLLFNVCPVVQADYFLIREQNNRTQIVQRINKRDIKTQSIAVAFVFHQRSYLFETDKQCFLPIRYQKLGHHLDQLKKNSFQPYPQSQREILRTYYNPNVIELKTKSKLQVFIAQMLTPYQVFQTYTIILWIFQQYYLFAFLLLAYALYTYWISSKDYTDNQKKLAQQSYFNVQCKVVIGQRSEHLYYDKQPNKDFQKTLKKTTSYKLGQRLCQDKDNHHVIEDEIEQPQVHVISEEKMIEKKGFNKFVIQKQLSYNLLPGDLIILKQNDTVPCDCILLTKQILADESFTTGKQYIVRKNELANYVYVLQKENNFTLFLGSRIAKVKSSSAKWKNHPKLSTFKQKEELITLQQNQVLCLVTQTNFNTQRGKFLREITHQKKSEETFTKQTIYFMYILLIITTIAFFILLTQVHQRMGFFSLIIFYLDLLSTCIPPTLPTALSVGINFAQIRLNRKNIRCILPENILTGGRADTIVLASERVFGKQYEVDSVSVGIKHDRAIGTVYTSYQQFTQLCTESDKQCGDLFFKALATCHTLQYYKERVQGQNEQIQLLHFSEANIINQDQISFRQQQLDVKNRIYFKAKDKKIAVLVEMDKKISNQSQFQPDLVKKQISLLEEIPPIQEEKPFSRQKSLQLSTSVYRRKRYIFIKGPPEKILTSCQLGTFPQTSYEYIQDMIEKGFLLYTYAYKQLKKQDDPTQQQLMQDSKANFTFLGFAVLRRKKQQGAQAAIMAFKKAKIDVLLVSEQREMQTNSIAFLNHICKKNQLLSCSLNKAKDQVFCRGHIEWQSDVGPNAVDNFISELPDFGKNSKLSLTSPIYEELFMKRQSANLNQIFEKSIVFSRMQHKHQRNLYYQLENKGKVSFAVGGGDTLAQCANLSMELGRGNCSLLSSFHTKYTSLEIIVHCLRICRAGLSTNFHCFNMMILFSLTQFTTVCLLQYNFQVLSDSQMLYEDLFVTFPIFVTMNMTKPTSKLSKQKPISSFFSIRALLSMIGLIVIQLLGQLSFLIYLISFSSFDEEKKSSYALYLQTGQFQDQTVTVHSTFILTNYIYLGIVLGTSVSRSFRKPFYTNPYYSINIALLWLYDTLIVIFPNLAPGEIRSQQFNTSQEFTMTLALVYGNLLMILMYLYENLLDWIFSICKTKDNDDQQRKNDNND